MKDEKGIFSVTPNGEEEGERKPEETVTAGEGHQARKDAEEEPVAVGISTLNQLGGDEEVESAKEHEGTEVVRHADEGSVIDGENR